MPTQDANPEPTDQPSAGACASPAGERAPPESLDFLECHRPALERDEVRHNVILANLGRLALDHAADLRRWTLGAPGACAVQTPENPIMLLFVKPNRRGRGRETPAPRQSPRRRRC